MCQHSTVRDSIGGNMYIECKRKMILIMAFIYTMCVDLYAESRWPCFISPSQKLLTLVSFRFGLVSLNYSLSLSII